MGQGFVYQRDTPDPSVDTVNGTGGFTQLTLGAAVTAVVGNLIGWDSTNVQWALADANSNPPIPAQFMAMAAQPVAGGTVPVCQEGSLFAALGLSVGTRYYLGLAPGSITSSAPTSSSTLTLLQPVGIAVSSTKLLFDLTPKQPQLLRFNVSFNPASLAANSRRSDTVTVTGLLTTDIIRGNSTSLLTGNGWNGGLMVQGYDVASTNTLRISLMNPTAGALDADATTFELLVERL